ncbi:hypothetical protein DMENIID0001_017340 [Sergentomyia squamirostris]
MVKKLLIIVIFLYTNITSTIGEMKKSWLQQTTEHQPFNLTERMVHMERSLNASAVPSSFRRLTQKPEEKSTKIDDKISQVQGHVAGFQSNKYKSTYVGNITKPDVIKVNSKLAKSKSKKHHHHHYKYEPVEGDLPRYSLGPGVKISIDYPREIVNVNLDEDYLRDILTGGLGANQTFTDNSPTLSNRTYSSSSGRGKRVQLLAKIIPLFILPFLVQSAVLPFMVSTLKLLLVKSIVVGKIAILLLILSAFKNYHKHHAYDLPYYNLVERVEPPSRRSEVPFYGYKVDGQTTWVN